MDISHSKANNESRHCPGPKLLYRRVSRLDRLCERLFFLQKNPPLSWKLHWRKQIRRSLSHSLVNLTVLPHSVCVTFRYNNSFAHQHKVLYCVSFRCLGYEWTLPNGHWWEVGTWSGGDCLCVYQLDLSSFPLVFRSCFPPNLIQNSSTLLLGSNW